LSAVWKKKESKSESIVISPPRNFRHESHIGKDPKFGFEIRNIPVEWKRIFYAAGVKKSELTSPRISQFIVETVTEAAKSNTSTNTSIQENNTPPASPSTAVRPPVPLRTSRPRITAKVAKAPMPPSRAGLEVLSDTNETTETIRPELPKIEENQEVTIVNVLAVAMKDRRIQIQDEEDNVDSTDDTNWVDEDFAE